MVMTCTEPRSAPKRPAETNSAGVVTEASVNFKKTKTETPPNANLQPLGKQRLLQIKVPKTSNVNRKWKLTDEDIRRRIGNLKSPSAQLESNASLFSLF